MCLIKSEIRRMKKIKIKENKRENGWERCLVRRGRGREFWWDLRDFSPDPPKHYLPHLGRKFERKLCKIFWT